MVTFPCKVLQWNYWLIKHHSWALMLCPYMGATVVSDKKNILLVTRYSKFCHWHLWRLSSNFSHLWKFGTNFSHRWKIGISFHICEHLVLILHICEKWVPILRRCEELVPIHYICENWVPILHIWEKSNQSFTDDTNAYQFFTIKKEKYKKFMHRC